MTRTSIKLICLSLLLCVAGMLAPRSASAGYELIMVESPGCVYCRRWTTDVGTEYPITPEGRFAPLRRVMLSALPEDLTLRARPVFTPTFILVEDGAEIGRLEGYAGEEFFWGLLGRLLNTADPNWATAGGD